MHKAINSLCPLARNIPSEIKRERNLLLSIKTQTAIARGTNVKKIQIHLTKVYSDTEAKWDNTALYTEFDLVDAR